MKKFLFILTIFLCFSINAQNIIKRDLDFNPAITNNPKPAEAFKKNTSFFSSADTLELPFVDDFSYFQRTVYPADSLWMDNYVFINNSFPVAHPTMGVATFDGLNEVGYPYDFTAPSNSSVPADTLTSKPLNLLRPASDSVIISFFYQARGRGNAPESKDSLVLEFKKPNQNKWLRVWSTKGFTPATSDTSFKYVMVNITDTAVLQKGGQFRFRNYATVSGGVDHWHLDYVQIAPFRSKTDTEIKDVSFVYTPPSLVKKYRAMPWEQYQSSDMQSSSRLFIRSNFNSATNMDTLRINVLNESQSSLYNYKTGVDNIDPFATNGYMSNPFFSNPALSFQFPNLSDTTRFIAKFNYDVNTSENISQNNKIFFEQIFHNYYAYDDGVAEYAFQVTGQTAQNARIAYKFDLNKADTLRGISIFFMPFLTNTSLEAFQLRVWGDSSGYPGALLYSESITNFPVYDKSALGKFHTYKLASPLTVPAGTIYVGYTQVTATGLNVGLDENGNAMDKIFVKFISNPFLWERGSTSGFTGIPMIRPVFGKDISLVGFDENENPSITSFSLYPNPANNSVNVICKNNHLVNSNVVIYSVDGREVISLPMTQPSISINTESLPNGIYFVKISAEENIVTYKLIISR